MAVVLPDLIDPAQGAFVKGRSISENILMAQELIRGYARKRISPRCMIMVDIRKAYDTRNNGTNHNVIPAVKRYLAHTLPGVVKALHGVGGIMAPSLTMYLRLRGTLAHTLPGCGKGLHAVRCGLYLGGEDGWASEMGRLISYRCEVSHADPVVSLCGLGNYLAALVLREPRNTCG
nr:orf129a gene product [Ipomoea batatas]